MFATATEPLTIAVGNDKQWRAFCGLLGLPLLADDPRFSTGAKRTANRAEVTGLVEEALRLAEAYDGPSGVPVVS